MPPLNLPQSLDHFVVPVDDMIAAEEFYVTAFGGVITKRNGLNVRQRKRGAVPHTFIQIGGKRMGVYLQSEERERARQPRGLPTYSFTTTPNGLDALMKALQQTGTAFDGPVRRAHSFADQTVFFTDPAANHYAVYTPTESGTASGATGRMTGVGYLELEAPDVNASIDFYSGVLGFDVQDKNENGSRATLKMASGQTLLLTRAPFSFKGLVMSRRVPGPHIAFYVPAEKWSAALKHLDTLGIANGDRGAAKERHDGQGGTYMDDPAGYVIQFITDGME